MEKREKRKGGNFNGKREMRMGKGDNMCVSGVGRGG
jgi:hypothetical protein